MVYAAERFVVQIPSLLAKEDTLEQWRAQYAVFETTYVKPSLPLIEHKTANPQPST